MQAQLTVLSRKTQTLMVFRRKLNEACTGVNILVTKQQVYIYVSIKE